MDSKSLNNFPTDAPSCQGCGASDDLLYLGGGEFEHSVKPYLELIKPKARLVTEERDGAVGTVVKAIRKISYRDEQEGWEPFTMNGKDYRMKHLCPACITVEMENREIYGRLQKLAAEVEKDQNMGASWYYLICQ